MTAATGAIIAAVAAANAARVARGADGAGDVPVWPALIMLGCIVFAVGVLLWVLWDRWRG